MGAWNAPFLLSLLMAVGFGRTADDQQPHVVHFCKVRKVQQDFPGNGDDTAPGECKIKKVGKNPWIIRFKSNTGSTEEKELMMHGVLISTTKVLTTTAWFSSLNPKTKAGGSFENTLWMVGYNFEKNCRQVRHARTAVWHPKSEHYGDLGSLGDFALYTPWKPFDVEGEPFLLQEKPHPVEEIDKTLKAKPESLEMHVFAFDVALKDHDHIIKEIKFHFVGLPECKELPDYKKQQKVNYDKEATDESFFCGNDLPAAYGEKPSSRSTTNGRSNEDGFSGAVALHVDNATGNVLPLGLYDYVMSETVDATRFFVAFTKIFFDWLDSAEFPESKGTTSEPSGRTEQTGAGDGTGKPPDDNGQRQYGGKPNPKFAAPTKSKNEGGTPSQSDVFRVVIGVAFVAHIVR